MPPRSGSRCQAPATSRTASASLPLDEWLPRHYASTHHARRRAAALPPLVGGHRPFAVLHRLRAALRGAAQCRADLLGDRLSVAPGDVDLQLAGQLAQPGELALGVA